MKLQKNYNNISDFLSWLIIPFAGIAAYVIQNKRRAIFLKNFKKEDLFVAEPCIIEKVKNNLLMVWHGNVSSLFGSVYKVVGKDDIYVIYNGNNSKNYEGVLVKYENQYYFINKKWIPKMVSQKSA